MVEKHRMISYGLTITKTKSASQCVGLSDFQMGSFDMMHLVPGTTKSDQV